MNPRGGGTGRRGKRLYLLIYIPAGLALVIVLASCAGSDSPARFILPFSFLGIAVLTNVEAGKNRFGRYREHGIPEIVGGDGMVIETETMEEIDGAIERFLSRGERLICFNGGDGTVQRALTRMINMCGEDVDELPVFFPLRGGTLNVLADNLGIKGKQDELCRRAVALDRSRGDLPCVEVPTLRLAREMGGKTEREYGFFFGNGALYRFDRVYYRETRGGPLPAAKLVLKCLGAGAVKRTRYKDIFGGMTPMRVTMDGFEMPCDGFIIVLAMIFKRVVLTFNPFRDEGEGDFYALAVGIPLSKMLTSLHKLFWVRGGEPPFPREVYYNQRVSRLVLESSEGYTLDGEVFELGEPHRLTMDLGPRVKILKMDGVTL